MHELVTILIYTFPLKGKESNAFAKIAFSIRETWKWCGKLHTVIVSSHHFEAVDRFVSENEDVELQVEPSIIPGKIASMSFDCIVRLYRRFTTPYVLIIQDDGYPIREGLEEFVGKYDFIGAPSTRDGRRKLMNWLGFPCLNGGFSLRSREICRAASRSWRYWWRFVLPRASNFFAEDTFYTLTACLNPFYRFRYRFANEREASRFSFDALDGAASCKKGCVPFGLHGKFTLSNCSTYPYFDLAEKTPQEMSRYERKMLVDAIEQTRNILLVNPQDGDVAELVKGFWNNDPSTIRRIVDWGKGLVPEVVSNRFIGDIGTYRNSIRSILFHTRFRGPLKVLVLTCLEEILRNAVLFNRGVDNGVGFYNLAHRLSFVVKPGVGAKDFLVRLIVKETPDGNRTWTVEFSNKKEMTEAPTTGKAATVKATHLNPPSTHTILKNIYDVNGVNSSMIHDSLRLKTSVEHYPERAGVC